MRSHVRSHVRSHLSSHVSFSSRACIYEIRQKLAFANKKGINVKIVWVPAHKGIQGNKKADVNAKIAAKEGKLLNVPIPVSDLFANIKKDCKEENSRKLIEISKEKGTFYFANFYSYFGLPWFFNVDLSRKAIVSINRIRSNHTSLNCSLFRQKIVQTETCPCGEDIDSIDHIIWSCNLYTKER